MPQNILLTIADRFKGRERIAKHPRTGKWHGIDTVLRCPVTDGYTTKDEAREAWRLWNAQMVGDVATRSHNV